MKKLLISLLFIPSIAIASDFNIEVLWQGISTSFTYIPAMEIFMNDGETSKVFQYDKKTDGIYYQNSSSFFGLLKSPKSFEGKYRFLFTVNKNKGGVFQLEGEKLLVSKVDQEVRSSNYASVSKSFSINLKQKCIAKDENHPTLKICISEIE